MKSVILFFLLLGFTACNSHKPISMTTQMDTTPLISLETSPCRGFCPVFKIAIKNDGQATYEGIRFVKTMGISNFQLSDTELADLKKQLDETNLWNYPEEVPITIADAPGSALTIYKGTESKTIRGTERHPKPVGAVQNKIKAIAQAHGYNLESMNPNEIPDNAPKKELLVKLKPEVNAGNWLNALNQSAKTNLRLVKRISADNIWVVVFDASKHATADILTLLKSNESVMEAQENKEAQERDKNE